MQVPIHVDKTKFQENNIQSY